MQKINLSIRERNPNYYDKSRDMGTALAWNAVKKILIENHREELFGYIQSVRLTEKYIIITTGKPIINAEILLIADLLIEKVNTDI